MTDNAVILADIQQARETIASTVRQTPLNPSPSLSDRAGVPVNLKLEMLQISGSFKLRGAANAIANLSPEQKAAGVCAISTGNHGRGLAYAAKAAGVRCIICMGNLVPQNKIDGIKALDAEVRIIGSSQDEAEAEVERLINEEGMVNLPPFDHPHIIGGAGTVGLELLEQMPDVQNVLVPVSGAGLLSGVAIALKAQKPGVKIIGISMERGAAMYESQQAGKPIQVPELATLADALGGGIGLDNAFTFNYVRDLCDEFLLVNEDDIANAIRHAYWEERMIVEGSGVVGIAAILSNKVKLDGPSAVLMTGQNLDLNLHHRIISGENVNLAEEEN